MRSNLFYVCLLFSLAYISVEGEENSTSESTPKPIESSSSSPISTVTEPSSTTGNNSTDFMCAICRSDNTAQRDCGSDVGEKFNTQCTLQPDKNETLEACYILRTGEFFGFGFLKT